MDSHYPIALTIRQGATFAPVLSVTGSDGEAFDFTGWSGRFQARPSVRSERVYFELSTTGGGIVIDGTAIHLAMSSSQTAGLEFDAAVYDLVLTSPGGSETRRDFEGTLTLDREVTR